MNFEAYWKNTRFKKYWFDPYNNMTEVAQKAFTQGIIETKLNVSACLECAKVQLELNHNKYDILKQLIKNLDEIISMGDIN